MLEVLQGLARRASDLETSGRNGRRVGFGVPGSAAMVAMMLFGSVSFAGAAAGAEAAPSSSSIGTR